MYCCLSSILTKLALYSYSTFISHPLLEKIIVILIYQHRYFNRNKQTNKSVNVCISPLYYQDKARDPVDFLLSPTVLWSLSAELKTSAMSRWALPHHFPRAVGGRVYFPLSAVYVNGKKEDGIASRPLIASRRVSAARRPGLK